MSTATCGFCEAFTVPWGDHVGPALMAAHQERDCPGKPKAARRRPTRPTPPSEGTQE